MVSGAPSYVIFYHLCGTRRTTGSEVADGIICAFDAVKRLSLQGWWRLAITPTNLNQTPPGGCIGD